MSSQAAAPVAPSPVGTAVTTAPSDAPGPSLAPALLQPSAYPTAQHDLPVRACDGTALHVNREALATRAPQCTALRKTGAGASDAPVALSAPLLHRTLACALTGADPVSQEFVAALSRETSADDGMFDGDDSDEDDDSSIELLLPQLLDLAHGALVLNTPAVGTAVSEIVRDAMFCAPRLFCRCFNVVTLLPDLLPGVDRTDAVQMLADWPERFLGTRDRANASKPSGGMDDADEEEGECEAEGEGEEEEDFEDDMMIPDGYEHGRVIDLTPQAWAVLLDLWPKPSRTAYLLQALYTWASGGSVLRRVSAADMSMHTRTDVLPVFEHGDPDDVQEFARGGYEWEARLDANAMFPCTRVVGAKFVSHSHNRSLIARDLARKIDRVQLGEKFMMRFAHDSGLL